MYRVQKWANPGLFFVYSCPFSNHDSNTDVLGDRTQGRRMVCTDGSTELWWLPRHMDRVISLDGFTWSNNLGLLTYFKLLIRSIILIILHWLSGLYGLVNNAGVCVCGEYEWQTWSQIQKQVEVNVLGTLRVTKSCIPLLKAGQGIEQTWVGPENTLCQGECNDLDNNIHKLIASSAVSNFCNNLLRDHPP